PGLCEAQHRARSVEPGHFRVRETLREQRGGGPGAGAEIQRAPRRVTMCEGSGERRKVAVTLRPACPQRRRELEEQRGSESIPATSLASPEDRIGVPTPRRHRGSVQAVDQL